MKTILFICFLPIFASSHLLFDDYIIYHNKSYSNEQEYNTKKEIYHENQKYVEYLNHKYQELEFEMNHFGDYTSYEFDSYMKGYNQTHYIGKTKSCMDSGTIDYTKSEDSWDWRDFGAITPVKDQGQCGSCWSFSATGSMEGAWAISRGELLSLSEQQLVDCSTKYINFGCNGGEMDHAFGYAIDNGMCEENDITYQAKSGSCSSAEYNCNKVATFSYCVDVTPNNEILLQEAVYQNPVSVAIEADTTVFQFYKGGILDNVNCGTNLDHGVLVVGYGSENNKDYWIVKNSWGSSWGENGYIRIAKSNSENDPGICGIAMQPSFIVV